MRTKLLGSLLLISLVWPVFAAPDGVVETLQMPTWVERDGKRRAVRIGMKLRDGDELVTGDSARLVLRLAEGSRVKLGEKARFVLSSLEQDEKDDKLFRGALDVLKGAFRFTTSLVSKSFRRELDVSVGVVTAGIRGTDIWGKSASDRDFVVLIEGEIGVRRGEEAESTLSRPLTAFVSPHDGLTERQATVSEDELAAWAEETEPQDGEGVVTLDGGWQVNLRSYRTMETAKMAQAGWEDKGYATDVQAVVVAGEKWFRLHVPGFATETDARSFATRIAEAWISRS